MPKQNKEASKSDALLGGRNVTIKLPDDSEETIFVRQVKASELMSMLQNIDREVAFLSMVTGKEADWLDNLSLSRPSEYNKLADAANEVNLDFFSSFFRRQKSRRLSLSGIGSLGELETTTQKSTSQIGSRPSRPKQG